jgi:hypothetical protein
VPARSSWRAADSERLSVDLSKNRQLNAALQSTGLGVASLKDPVGVADGHGSALYCESANIPPAKECQAGVTLIGQFSSFTAISAAPP